MDFVIAVAANFNITLNGNADSIVGEIGGASWSSLKDGPAASAAAAQGKFVVGGLTGADTSPAQPHGHVVVVVDGPLDHQKYPTAFWGSDNGSVRKNGDGDHCVNWAWNPASRDKVTYASHDVSAGILKKLRVKELRRGAKSRSRSTSPTKKKRSKKK
jgi:hypothetical protein